MFAKSSEYACVARCINPCLLQYTSALRHCCTCMFECLSENMSMFSCKFVSIFGVWVEHDSGCESKYKVARRYFEGNTVKGNGIVF